MSVLSKVKIHHEQKKKQKRAKNAFFASFFWIFC